MIASQVTRHAGIQIKKIKMPAHAEMRSRVWKSKTRKAECVMETLVAQVAVKCFSDMVESYCKASHRHIPLACAFSMQQRTLWLDSYRICHISHVINGESVHSHVARVPSGAILENEHKYMLFCSKAADHLLLLVAYRHEVVFLLDCAISFHSLCDSGPG